MDFRHRKMRVNGEVDRLSSLRDDLIHRILSFIGIKDAIQTSVLSSRWRFIWISLPYLNFSTKDFYTLTMFSKFVTRVFSRRNTEVEVSSVKLSFLGDVTQMYVKKILNYAFSHNVQQMTLIFFRNKDMYFDFPLSIFSSKSLKHLSISMVNNCNGDLVHYDGGFITVTSTWEIPALTTLYLDKIIFDDIVSTDKCLGVLSKCPNLKNLTINECSLGGAYRDGVSICHPGLSNLTLENAMFFSNKVMTVVAPQLKNLTIRDWSAVKVVSAPKLTSLVFRGSKVLHFSREGICSLEKADFCFDSRYHNTQKSETIYHKIIHMLQQLHNVMFLTLNSELVQFLSTFPELISHPPSPFANLKNLKVYPYRTFSPVQVTIPTVVQNYLLGLSPGAIITTVSLEEMRALQNAELAENLMAKFQVLLEQEKANIKTNRAPIERHGSQLKRQKAKMPEKEKTENDKWDQMLGIVGCWKNMYVQIKQGGEKIDNILLKKCHIESKLTDIHPSKKAKIQACFATLCDEADVVINKIMDSMKIKCEEKQSIVSVSLGELDKPSPPPS